MKKTLGAIWSHFIKYFGQGLLFVVPITATAFVLYVLFEKVDTLIPMDIPGLGLLFIIVSVSAVGFFGSLLVTSPLFKWVNKLINRTPIIKIIYSSVSDLLSAFVGNKKKFTQAVLVKFNYDSEVSQIGFLTQEDITDLGVEGDMVSVYIPFSYSIAGNVYVVPRKNVTRLDASPTEVMKFVVSGGISNVSEQRNEENK